MAADTPMPRASYDLHVHTCYSYDATAPVREVFTAARQVGVRVVAITDHHIVDGLPEARQISAEFPDVTCVIGAELTVHGSIGATDMVCLGFTDASIAALGEVWDAYHEWQREYGDAICRGMQALGHDYTRTQRVELLRSYRPPITLQMQGATHVANKMQREYFIERGFIETPEQYGEVLAEAGKLVPRPNYPAAEFVLPPVKAQGVLVAIAHPTGYFQRDAPDRMALLADELLLDGVECAHPGVPPELTPVYRQWCLDRGLLSTAGTDPHWEGTVRQSLGMHLGEQSWWPEIAARLPEGSVLNP